MKTLLLIFGSVVLLLTALSTLAAPSSEAIKFWLPHNDQSEVMVSHETWQGLLDQYLRLESEDGIYRFDYASVDSNGKRSLDAYLQALYEVDPRQLNRAEQFAYWVNLYNSLTVQVVLSKFPVIYSTHSILVLAFWAMG